MLNEVPPSEELLVVAFNITRNFDLIRRHWRNIGDPSLLTSSMFGGEVSCFRIQHRSLKLISTVEVRTPLGLYHSVARDSLLTSSDHWIMEIKSGAVASTLSNRLFNCLHWMSPSFREGVEAVYVASTGIDAILEIDLARPRVCLWDWLATEHGYDRSANGKPRGIDRAIFHQGIEYSTLTHTTHVNSIAQYDENTLLATLFHQGELVTIDLHSKAVSSVIKGLRNPHSIRRRQNGFMVCDTRGSRVLFLDEGLSECHSIKGDFNWVQDACELADGTVVIADANNHRLLRVDPSGARIWEWEYGTDRRIGSLLPLSAAHCGAIFSSASFSAESN